MVVRYEKGITAPLERIWALLAAFELYSQWNPMVRQVNGPSGINARPEMVIELPEIGSFKLKPRILTITDFKEITWKSSLRLPGVLTWKHTLLVEPVSDERQKVIQLLTFSGLLAPLFVAVMERFLVAGCEKFHEALRKWSEKEILCSKC